MPMSYANFDPDSDRAKEQRKAKVSSFLERHGFLDSNTPRDNEPYRRISIEPPHPLEVAKLYKDDVMVALLKESGAKNPPGSGKPGGILKGLRSMGSLESRRSMDSNGTRSSGQRSSTESAAPVTPKRSCISIRVAQEVMDENELLSSWV